MWELIDLRAGSDPDAVMLIDESDRTLTFSQFRDRAERVAAGLSALGVEAGTPFSWQLPTCIDTIVLSGALSRLGAVQNPVIHLYRERELSFALAQTGARFLAIPGVWRSVDYPAIAARAMAGLDRAPRVISSIDGWPEADPAGLGSPPAGLGSAPTRVGSPPDLAPEADSPVRWIYYTSGSTAQPKGVRHTDATLMAGGRGLALALDMSGDDVGTIAFPYAHIAGPDYLVTMLTSGFPAVVVEAFSAKDQLDLFRRWGVTMVGGSTAFYIAFLSEQRKQPGRPVLPTLRLMSGGGASKPPQLHFEVKREVGGRGTVHGYGMTEVPMIAQGSPHDSDEQLANTDGKPVAGAEVRIVTLGGNLARPDEEGEILVRGPMVFRGYTDPALDGDAFDDDGFFRTGDLGRLRPDGHLVITGRLKDVIVRKGENISAREIEDILYTHPKVQEVAVIGLPDPERGERVCAVVQQVSPGSPSMAGLAPGDSSKAPDPSKDEDVLIGEEPLTLEEVVEFCRGLGMMTQKIPEQLELRADMPRAGTGKIVKTVLREEYATS